MQSAAWKGWKIFGYPSDGVGATGAAEFTAYRMLQGVCNMIKKVKGGYKVLSEKTGRNLGGLYKTKEEAKKRLQQVEFFKRKKG